MSGPAYRRRAVITGYGIVSSIGVGVDQVSVALREGVSGVRLLPERQALGFRSSLSGVIDGFLPRYPLSRKDRKSLTEFGQWAYDATREALAMSRLPDEIVRSPRTGVIFGNDSTAAACHEQAVLTREAGSTSSLHSGMVFQAMTSCITMNLASLLGIRGAAWTIGGACASGGHAAGQALEWIASGRQDRVLCGAAQETTWESVCSFDALCAFSTREDDPEGASRPFDAGRDGLVPSGGAAALVLEERGLALERGAPVLGEVLSYAFSSDGAHIALSSGEGLARCMAEAIDRAGLDPEDIDYINAHATSTPQGDATEADAIAEVFGSARPWISSTKSMTGHEMWMSGASQLVYSLVMGQGGFIAGNRNFERPDEKTRGLRIATEAVPQAPNLILCNSAGFGGTNACVVLRIGE